MNIKVFSLILTVVLIFFGAWFVNEFVQICYQCNPVKALTDEMENSDIIIATVNFVVAFFSLYLIFKKKFITSTIVCGVIAGLQLVMITMMFINAPL